MEQIGGHNSRRGSQSNKVNCEFGVRLYTCTTPKATPGGEGSSFERLEAFAIFGKVERMGTNSPLFKWVLITGILLLSACLHSVTHVSALEIGVEN